ncbi:putative delta-60 repeat protein [Flavobacterium sp. PL11]|uniref:calcium-binding protein n=1 Tax=Flavobacterium sp. PL11 TaxID=3071717 RepID=UPI002E020B8F|nr:putative delta-60 repeat protein [Flavobacterium sp. PL11]
MKTKLCYLVIAISILFINTVYPQQGKVDTTFNTYDDGSLGDGFNGAVRTVALQSDGNLIVGGDFLSCNGNSTAKLTRLLPDGSIDVSFNTGIGFDGNVYATTIQADGKIIVGGAFKFYNGIAANRLIRLNSDGSRDLTFNTSIGSTNGTIYTVAIQTNGRIIIGGSFTNYYGATVNKIARILPNGLPDNSFISSGAGNGFINTLQIQPDGKILVAGTFNLFTGIAINKMIRLNVDGSWDNTFNIGNGFDDDIRALAIQADGKIVIGGDFTKYNESTANRIVRLNSDGTHDTTFNSGTGFSAGYVSVVKITAIGEMMIGGSFTGNYNGIDVNRLILLDANGVVVPPFDIGDGPGSATVLTLEMESTNSWFVGGSFSVFDSQNQGRLAKIGSDGSLEIGFLTSGVGFNNSVAKVISLSDNKTLVFGNFTKFNGVKTSRITRLLDDGVVDSSFNPSANGADNFIRNAVKQTDGKIILAGSFRNYNNVAVNRICRIQANGIIDPSFVIGSGFNNQVYALATQSDGKIIVGGNFTIYNTINSNRIIRLLTDGSIDPTFNVGMGADGIIEVIYIQPDGKILLGGRFTHFNEYPYNKLVRLNTDGSVDSSFSIGTGIDKNVYTIALQSSGKIIIGGSFLNYNGFSAKRIVRLNSNGSYDSSFITGAGFSKGEIRTILVQLDDHLLIGGTFSGTYNAIVVQRMLRLLPNGVYDATFKVDLNNTLFSIAFTEDAKVIIGGNFNLVSSIPKHRIARIKLCIDSSTWNGTNWSNGAPSLGKALTFNGNYNFDISAKSCSCFISSGNTVAIKTGNTLSLTSEYSGLGRLIVENNASLFQSDDATINSGIINVHRKTTPIVKYDYTYWSSPVLNQKLIDVSPNTLVDKYYSYNPSANSWFLESPINNMIIGQGYIIRGPQNFSENIPEQFEAVFKGIPNNGNIAIPVNDSNTSHLLGNPYPSAISADRFLALNTAVLEGTLYFWTHNTPLTNNQYAANDYAVYNIMGGVGTSQALNSGVNNNKPNGTIASGQSFFTTSKNSGNVIYNNSMRLIDQNGSFFRSVATKKWKSNEIEKHRIWLNLFNNEGAFKQILIGYTTNATDEFDSDYDGESRKANKNLDFYSILANKNLVIQGRALPFNDNDSIALGYNSAIKGSFTISIDEIDGLLLNQSLFLEDKIKNVVFDLKKKNYNFDTEIGTFNDRFVLRYTNKALNIDNLEIAENNFYISLNKGELNVNSSLDSIDTIYIYTIGGKLIYQTIEVNKKNFLARMAIIADEVLIVKVLLKNGTTISKKIIARQ